MRNLLITTLAILGLGFSAYSQCCTYTIDGQDSWGDGWNGGFANIYINGVLFTSFDVAASTNSLNFTACDGDNIEVEWNSGTWDSEVTFQISSPAGEVGSYGPSPSVGIIDNLVGDCSGTPPPGGGQQTGGTDCSTLAPICTDVGLNFTANTGGLDADVIDPGNNYDCLFSQPNPSWYYFEIATNGNIDMSLSAPTDIDFIIYGPYPDLASAEADCGGYGNPANTVEDCSYSATNNETPSITNAQVGDVYVMLITNYSNQVQDITLQQTGGAGSTDCTILEPCNIDYFEANISACTGGLYDISGTVDFTDEPTTGDLVIEDCNGNIYTIDSAPFPNNGTVNYNLTGLVADGAPCDVTVYFTDATACSQTLSYTAPQCLCFMTFLQTDIGACNPTDNTFDITGYVEFQDAPTTGQLIVEDCNGNQQVFNAPFTSPTNYALTGIDSDGTTTGCTVTAYFTDDPTCSITSGTFDYPNPCVCTADAGTWTDTPTGSTSSTGPYTLCFNDQLSVSSNGDLTYPQDLSATFTTITYDPGTWLLVYDCPPTVGPPDDINNDPCLLGVASTANGAWNILNDVGDNSTYYFVPVTMYSMTDGIYAVSINGGDWCYDLGEVFEVTYLPEIVTSFTQDCAATSATVTVNGGLPSFDGSNFTATNLSPANASFTNTTTGEGGTIEITGLNYGDNWSFDITDDSGCPVTVSGTFFAEPTITAATLDVCVGDVISLNGAPGPGTAPAWVGTDVTGSANLTNTGSSTVNVAGVSAGTVDVAYTDLNGCTVTETVTVNPLPIVDVPDVSVCVGGSVDLTASGADTYTWSPGTYLNTTTGATVTSTPAADITYTITGTDANGCVNTDVATVTVSGNAPIDAGPDVTICDGASTTLTASGGVTYTWDDGTGGLPAGNGISVSPTTTTLYTVTGTDASGCIGTDQMTVTVDPIPTVDPVADQTLCANTATTDVVFTGSVAGTTYDWTNDNTNVGLAASGSGDILSFTATNAGTTSETATITVTPTANGCVGTPITFTITVDPIPTVDPITDETLCAGSATTAVNFTGSVAGATYDWTNDNTATGLGAAGTGNIGSFSGTNAGSVSEVSTVTVTPTANGCVGLPETFTITVDPIPTVDPVADQTLCNNPVTADVIFTGAVAGTTYDWTNDNTSIGLAASGSGDILSFTAVNTGSTTQVATITVTPTANGCVGTPITFTYTVFPIPTVDPFTDQVLCAGDATTAVVPTGAVAGTTFDWTNDNTNIGLGASGTGNIASFAPTAGTTVEVATITYIPTANGCTGAPESFTITVNPIPTVDPVADQTLCNNPVTADVIFTGAVAGTTYDWTMSDDIGVGTSGTGDILSFTAVNGTSSTIVSTVTVTPSVNGCVGTPITFTYTVFPIPNVDPITDQTLCEGSATAGINFTGSVAGTTFDWTNSNTSIGLGASGTGNITPFNVVNTGSAPEVATITVTPTANGCTGAPETFTITVNPLPTAVISGTAAVCENDTDPTVTITGAEGVAPYTFEYNINGGATQTVTSVGNVATITVPSTPAGTYNYNLLSVTDASGTACSQTQTGTATITVNPNPVPVITGPTDYCTGTFATLTTTQAYANYNWSTGATTASVNVTAADNPITVTVTDANGCTATSAVFTVTENAVITYNSSVEICDGETATIHGNIESVAGVYSATYTTPSGCDSTSNVTLIVNPLPAVDAGLDQEVCDGTQVTLVASGAQSYVWDTGVSNGVQFTPALGATVHTVTGTDANGCVNTDQVTVTVNPLPTATIAGTNTICVGDGAQTITFTGANGTAPYTFTYSLNGGAPQTITSTGNVATITVSDAVAGTWSYDLISVSDATATACSQAQAGNATVVINPLPTATIAGTVDVCVGATQPVITFTGANGTAPYTFTYTINGGAPTTVSTGSGSNTATVSVSTTTAGTFSYDLVSVQDASSTACNQTQTGNATVVVNPLPTATIAGTTTLCVGDPAATITFTGANGTAPYTFTYNINGAGNQTITSTGNTATITVPTATAGVTTYNLVSVTDASTTACNQAQTGSATVTVNPLPTATITGDVIVCVGDAQPTITFTGANGTAPYTFTYTINGVAQTPITSVGNTATVLAPTTTAGTFAYDLVSVQDASTTACNQTQTGTATVVVNPLPTATIAGTVDVCENDAQPTITFTGANGTAPYTFTYTINGGGQQFVTSTGNVATIQVPTNVPGTFTYTLQSVSDASPTGCSQFQTGTATVVVNPLPTATIAGDIDLCVNAAQPTITFTGAGGTAPYTFTYTINGVAQPTVTSTGNVATVLAPTTAAGTYVYELVSVQDASTTSCSQAQTGTATVNINPIPTATIAGDAEVCIGASSPVITFTGAGGVAPYTFEYSIDNGPIQTVTSTGGNSATILASTANAGTFTYDLISVTDGSATGCGQAQSGTVTITVNPLPTATISGDAEVCLNGPDQTITFTGANGTAPYTFTYTVNGGPAQTITSTGNTATITVPADAVGVTTFSLVSVQDASATGCSQAQTGLASVEVVGLPPIYAGVDFTICEGDDAVLTASGGTGYVWDNGVQDGVPFNPTQTNEYVVIGVNPTGCVNSDTVVVTVSPLPVPSFVADTTAGCAPLEVTFTNTTPGQLTDCIWTLSNGAILNGCGSVSYVFTQGGTYDVTLQTTTTDGCTAQETYQYYIYVEQPAIADFSASSTVVSTLDSEVEFINESQNADDYIWSFGDGSAITNEENPIHVFPNEEFGTYGVTLIATTPLGCNDTAYVVIKVEEELIFYVPNTFTPDDDDYNPTFQPVFTSGYDPFDYTLLIFNRWGEIIFESHNVDIGWDGTYGTDEGKRVEVQDGTYTWTIEFKTVNTDERVYVNGHVNVLR